MSSLPVVPVNGLRADSLGAYLASLGLFSLVAREWPCVRAVWRNGCFCLIGGPTTLEQTVEFVSDIGQQSTWTKYDKSWDMAKKTDVEESGKGKDRKTSRRTARWRALEAEERLLPAFGAHLALDVRVRMNPLLGTGGNAGKRDFAKGWKDAVQVIKEPPRDQGREVLNKDLEDRSAIEATATSNFRNCGFAAAKSPSHCLPSTSCRLSGKRDAATHP